MLALLVINKIYKPFFSLIFSKILIIGYQIIDVSLLVCIHILQFGGNYTLHILHLFRNGFFFFNLSLNFALSSSGLL